MELEIKQESNSPIKTFEKKEKPKVYYTINKLTSALPLTTDQIFKIFKNNNKDILLSLTGDGCSVLEKDYNCRCFSMKNKKNNYNKKCRGCQVISRLIKTNYLEKENIEIFTGRNKNMFINVKNYPFFGKDSYSKNLMNKQIMIYFGKSLKNIETYNTDVEYFCTDNEKYNYIINSMIMNEVLKEEKLCLYNNFLWSFVCNGILTIMKKNSIFNNLEELCKSPYYSNYSSPVLSSQERKLLKSTVYMILKQLLFFLKTMTKSYFIHGDPSINYISYINEKITIRDETFPLKLVIESSNWSSQNYEEKRYVYNPENKILNFGIPFEKLDVHINGSKNYFIHFNILNSYDEMSILFYKIGKKSKIFNKIRNNYGIPICYKSFDFVCFLISFINDDYFFKTFQECEHLNQIWKLLWRTDEYESLMKDIKNMPENTFENIFDVVKKYHIRVDALEYFYNEIFN